MAAHCVGCIYIWGQGVAIDYPRAFAAYKVSAEGGNRGCQAQLGSMYALGHGVPQDYKQARAWFEKAAAQDYPDAVKHLGTLHFNGTGVTQSWRRTREYWERAIQLGNSKVQEDMDMLNRCIHEVTASPIQKI